MKADQHLSDEAVAAFADNALPRAATERARRHTALCAECAYAVAVQREAVWALRAAPPPSLPTSLMDRLRQVPTTTPLDDSARQLPAALDERGNLLFRGFGGPPFGAASFVRQHGSADTAEAAGTGRRRWPVATAVAAAAAAGGIAAAVALTGGGGSSGPSVHMQPVHHVITVKAPAGENEAPPGNGAPARP